MRKITVALLLVAAMLVLSVGPSLAGGKGGGKGGGGGHGKWHGPRVRSTVVFGVGPAFWWGYPYPWYYPYYYPYYYPPYYYPPSQPAEPPVYIEQSTQGTQAPASFWYYCQSASAYYPSAPSCPEAWIKVAPRTE
jgi:hypothetical protein